MTLLERAVDVEKTLGDLVNLEQRKERLEKLHQRSEELQDARNALGECIGATREYRRAGLSVQFDDSFVGTLRERFIAVANAFRAAPEVQTLSAGSRWVRLMNGVKTVTDSLSEANQQTWQRFLSEECTVDSPIELESRLPPTAQNQAALSRYKNAHRVLMASAQRPARTAEDVQRIRGAASEVRRAQAEFSFDYPEEVIAFLRAAHAHSGASLESLSESALTWMREHRMLNQFRVRPVT